MNTGKKSYDNVYRGFYLQGQFLFHIQFLQCKNCDEKLINESWLSVQTQQDGNC